MSEYPASRVFQTSVSAVTQVSPHLRRITLTSPDLQYFAPYGLDLRIKLLFPGASGEHPRIGFLERPIAEWYPEWRALPVSERGMMRTYTARSVRPQEGELDIEFVLHGVAGPASAWATHAQLGDPLLLLGPDVRSDAPPSGIDWHPGNAEHLLIAGDETALPAIAAILEVLPMNSHGKVFLEIPEREDELRLVHPAGMELTWLPRAGRGHGDALVEEVRRWGDAALTGQGAAPRYAWFAGESGLVKTLRRYLVGEHCVDRRQVSFTGYWKRGAAEQN